MSDGGGSTPLGVDWAGAFAASSSSFSLDRQGVEGSITPSSFRLQPLGDEDFGGEFSPQALAGLTPLAVDGSLTPGFRLQPLGDEEFGGHAQAAAQQLKPLAAVDRQQRNYVARLGAADDANVRARQWRGSYDIEMMPGGEVISTGQQQQQQPPRKRKHSGTDIDGAPSGMPTGQGAWPVSYGMLSGMVLGLDTAIGTVAENGIVRARAPKALPMPVVQQAGRREGHLLREMEPFLQGPLDMYCNALEGSDELLSSFPSFLSMVATDLVGPEMDSGDEARAAAAAESGSEGGSSDDWDSDVADLRRSARQQLMEDSLRGAPHAECGKELLGIEYWPQFTTIVAMKPTPLRANEQRYHRRHLWQVDFDAYNDKWWCRTRAEPLPVVSTESSPSTSAANTPNSQAAPIQPKKACRYNTPKEVSLRDESTYVLLEGVEQYPILMHQVGMSAYLNTYLPASSRVMSPAPPSDTLGRVRYAGDDGFIPGVYGGNVVRFDPMSGINSCTLIESVLLRAPLFEHQTDPTDFLFIRCQETVAASKGRGHNVKRSRKQQQQTDNTTKYINIIRPLQRLVCMGQAEPLVKVDPPLPAKINPLMRSRIVLETRKSFRHYRRPLRPDDVVRMFGHANKRTTLERFIAAANHELQVRPGQPMPQLDPSAEMSLVESCKMDSMLEGIRRLCERGVTKLVTGDRIRQAVREIETHESSMSSRSKDERVRYDAMQVEAELKTTPWSLSNDYWEVVEGGKRGAFFEFSHLGDPSGGRGEGVSYVRQQRSVDAALGAGGVASGQRLSQKLGDLRAKSAKELRQDMRKLGTPEAQLAGLGRWELVRQLSVLLRGGEDADVALAAAASNELPAKRKQLHSERLATAWRKQYKALSREDRDFSDVDSDDDDANEADMSKVGEDKAPIDSLEDDLLADLMDSSPKQEQVAADSGEEIVPRLKIVTTGREKVTGAPWTRVQYVYGRHNIDIYKRWKMIDNVDSAALKEVISLNDSSGGGGSNLDKSLKIHQLLRESIEQGKLAPKEVTRCSRCHFYGHEAEDVDRCPVKGNVS
ncbi:hypothetical protein Pmar_PMAR007621 [Perkinsus marinus ATCC 50983]|uniref:Transcription initiation factor TFIID subunit 1 histone acetyltransferase domain-containing protein n=1 Tax=Perkinsus marinus (strain ATCC 50983 / TXsc) TaxID=423536 RepID=C5LMN7_PERM5|nr:hypothetical protein Pmar_PMAR007621 [Perkinsus marinus ATCC 50983]EER01928.1 hypothetical protein Pmar_PMAR007621 [Perkinsus marinus ATCC 50983]|eukprot:XP_002769210.1 hypothetical protein Pmar_PMAR007621 [Perkinsus marinus ATCC 50983]